MDTLLSNCLRKGGCSPNQAAAFERCLEDRPICGVGTSTLTRAILAFCVSDMEVYVSAIRELQQESRNLKKQVMDYESQYNGLEAYR